MEHNHGGGPVGFFASRANIVFLGFLAIAGYFLLRVKDRHEAIEIAQQCPTLKYGVTVEVRPVAEQCPHMQHLNEQLAHAMT